MKILKRKYLASELNNDPDIERYYYKDNFSLEQIREEWKSLKNVPISDKEKRRLKNYLIHSNQLGIVKVKRGKIYVFKWPTGELRCFVASSNGTLIEPYVQSNWYSAYPFLEIKSANEITFREDLFKSKERIAEKIFLPPSNNFSHFILDSLAPLLQLSQEMEQWKNFIEVNGLFTFNDIREWQNEFIQLLGYCSKELKNIRINDQFTCFDIEDIYIPIKTNLIDAGNTVRRCLAKHYMPKNNAGKEQPELIMITRNDARRARIDNIDEIESLVREHGGAVIDATSLNLKEKIDYFSKCRLCIAESSGCLNWSFFAPHDSILVALTDSDILTNPDFTLGGFIYFLGMMDRIIYLKGEKKGDVPGSPVGSSRYDVKELRNIIIKQAFIDK